MEGTNWLTSELLPEDKIFRLADSLGFRGLCDLQLRGVEGSLLGSSRCVGLNAIGTSKVTGWQSSRSSDRAPQSSRSQSGAHLVGVECLKLGMKNNVASRDSAKDSNTVI